MDAIFRGGTNMEWEGAANGFAELSVLSRKGEPGFIDKAARLARAVGLAAIESIWTTRCIICDTPGDTLCPSCRLRLPYIDRWMACPRCGSPHGSLQCVSCNSFSLAEVERTDTPFERCVSAIEYRGMARSIVTGYKDAGERRLSADMAHLMANAIPRSWQTAKPALTYIPADKAARRRRGFDHMSLVADELARQTGLSRVKLLEKLPASDQRGLGRAQRFENMAGSIRIAAGTRSMPECVIVADDVYTTGATLFAACDALKAAGAQRVLCITFARVP